MSESASGRGLPRMNADKNVSDPRPPAFVRVRISQNQDALIAFVIALASFLLYLRTLAPGVVDADGGEFQFAAWNFSFVHPTGYPLYLILGGLFQHLVPIGNPAFRLNVFTAITGALAVGTVYLAAHEITRHRGAAMVAAVSFALTRTFWFDAGAAETYDLNAFFVALLVFIALRWQSKPSAKTFTAFCFAFGLALTHHRTIVLWLPAFALFFAIVVRQLRRGFHVSPLRLRSGQGFTFYFCLFAFLLPLTLYLYIPLRAPASPYATLALAPGRDIVLYQNSAAGFANYLLGRVFQSELGWDAVSVARLALLSQFLIDQFTLVGIVLGVIGVAALLWKKEWARSLLLVVGFAATVLFAASYHIGDIFHYYIPAYLVWAVWIGAGVAGIVEIVGSRQLAVAGRVISRQSPVARQMLAAFCLVLSAFLLIPFQFVSNFAFADRSGETRERDQWTRILSAPILANAILISNDRDEMMPMWYMQYVEDTRRDLLGLFPVITPAPQYANIARLTDSVLDAGRPVYFIKPMPGIEIKYRVASAPPLVRVLGPAFAAPPQFAADATIADRVRVVGYDVTREPGVLRVVVYWQPRVKLDANYTSFVHLIDANGNKVAQGNDHQVGGDYYPSSMWDVGETLRDEQAIALPQNLAPGTYRLVVGMYAQPDMQMLGNPVEIGKLQMTSEK
jgi:Protein O-mannosyl-transferase TMEM260-like